MTTLPRLAVTRSSGALGGLVARELATRGIAQRLLARTPAKTPVLQGAVAVPFSYTDRDAAARALDGVATLFMVSASESADRLEQHLAFVDREGGRRPARRLHVVLRRRSRLHSHARAGPPRDRGAHQASGTEYTFLRDNFYLDLLPDLVGKDGVIRGPADEGRVAAVARADIARVAATVLSAPQVHRGATYAPLPGQRRWRCCRWRVR